MLQALKVCDEPKCLRKEISVQAYTSDVRVRVRLSVTSGPNDISVTPGMALLFGHFGVSS